MLFDDLVGAGEDRRRHGQSERPGGLEIDHQLEPRWLLDRKIGRLGALEDLPDVSTEIAISVGQISSVTALAAKNATSSIPIVFLAGADPVEEGLVASLAAPSGNLTGVTLFATELCGKRVELLSELVPGGGLAQLVNPQWPGAQLAISSSAIRPTLAVASRS